MRKLFVLLAASAAVLAVFGPAQAATKQYTMTLTDRAYRCETASTPESACVSESVIDTSNGHDNDYVKVSGKIGNGPLKSRPITVVGTNLYDPDPATRTKSFTTKTTSTGTFAVRHVAPARGGKWEYKATVGNYGTAVKGTYRKTDILAFHFTFLEELLPQGYVPPTGVSGPFGDNSVKFAKTGSSSGAQVSAFTIRGGSQLEVDIRGPVDKPWNCKKIQFRLGVADEEVEPGQEVDATAGKVQVLQPGKGYLLGTTTMDSTPGAVYQPSDAVRNKLSPSAPLIFKVLPRSDGNDPAAVRFLLGDPKLFCTFPSTNN